MTEKKPPPSQHIVILEGVGVLLFFSCLVTYLLSQFVK
jgi:hypothetical protein